MLCTLKSQRWRPSETLLENKATPFWVEAGHAEHSEKTKSILHVRAAVSIPHFHKKYSRMPGVQVRTRWALGLAAIVGVQASYQERYREAHVILRESCWLCRLPMAILGCK